MVHFRPILIVLDIFQDGRGTLVVIPESRGQRQLFIVVDFGYAVIVVKETSSRPKHGLS
jgi:hypothetical protein